MAIRIPIIFDGDMSGLQDMTKSATKRVGGLLATGLKRGAQVAGGGMAAVIGTSLVKGFNRLNAIDQAEGKLRGLGYTAKDIAGVMANANTAVTGTAFGLADAVTASASALAAGIKPGKDLTRTLSLIGDTATIAGAEYGEIASIFNKVAAGGLVQGEELAQLGDRGIPILQLLSKELGVSALEVKKLASEGQVDFATFQKALEGGLGGAAQESGKTFQGALSNVGAALGRLGATVLGPIFERLPGILMQIQTGLGTLTPYAEKAAEVLGGAFNALISGVDWESISTALQNVGAALSTAFSSTSALSTVSEISGSLTGLQQAFGDLVSAVVTGVGSLDWGGFFSEITGALGPLMSALATTGQAVSGFFTSILPTVMDVAGQLMDALGPAIASISDSLSGKLLPAINKVIPILAPVVKTLLRTFGPPMAGVIKGLGAVISGVVDTIAGVIDLVVSLLTGDWSGAWEAAKGIVSGVIKAIGGIVRTFFNSTLMVIFRTMTGVLVSIWQGLWNTITGLISGAFSAIVGAVRAGLSAIGTAITNIASGYAAIFSAAFKAIRSVVAGAFKAIRSVVAGAFKAIRSIFTNGFNLVRRVVTTSLRAIQTGFTSGFNAVKNVVTSVFSTIRTTISGRITDIVGLVKGIPGRMLNAARSFLTAGKNLAGKVWEGLKAGFRNAGGAIGDVLDSIRSGINDLLGLPKKIGKGPVSFTIPAFAQGTNFAPGGVALVGENGPELVDIPRGSRVRTASETRALARRSPLSGTGPASSSVVVNQNYYGPTTGSERMRELDWTLRYATKAAV